MQSKILIDMENICRLREIAETYHQSGQIEKSEKYHEIIIEICNKYPKNEQMMTLKMLSLIYLKKEYKSLEITNEILHLNPSNAYALSNIVNYLMKNKKEEMNNYITATNKL